MTPIQQQIVEEAMRLGINPAVALAYAERESSFNPRARSSKTIRGLFQMKGDLREQYGVGDSDDVGTQTRGWAGLLRQNRQDMRRSLGRDPTDDELYAAHHFGAGRAARMLKMDPNTPVDQVFTQQELALNPHLGRAGTVGGVNTSVIGDMARRRERFASTLPDFTGSADAPDFASFGTLADQKPAPGVATPPNTAERLPKREPAGTGAGLDFAQFGTPLA